MTIPHPDASEAKLEAFQRAEIERVTRNRDMWKEQVERQAAKLTSLRAQLAEQRAEIEALKRERAVFAAPGGGWYSTRWEFEEAWKRYNDQLAATNARIVQAEKVIDAIMHLTPHSVHIGYERTTSGNFSYEDAVLLSDIADAARAWRNKDGT